MRVVVLSGGCPTPEYPFNGIFQFEQAKALRAAGHEVLFAVADLRSLRRKRPLGLVETERDGTRVITANAPVGAVPPPLAGFAAVLATRALFRRIAYSGFAPEIVHAHFAVYYGMAAAANMGLLPGAALVVTEHASEITSGGEVGAYSMRCMRRAYGAAGAVIAVGGRLKARIRELTGVDAALIPNMFDDGLFFPDGGESGADADPAGGRSFDFVSVGHLVPGKRTDRLIRAYAEAFGTDPSRSLTVLGEGPERASLESLIASLGLTDRVRLPGSRPRKEIAETLRNSDCFATASENETFGLACVEALACGLPVVATRCGGPEEFVDDGNGILVDVGDIGGMAKALGRMAEARDRPDRATIARAASARFSPGAVAAAIGDVYADAARMAAARGSVAKRGESGDR